MDKYETRRLNLRALIHSHCGGRAATLADLIERSPSYVSRMLYPEGRDGKKRIGEDMRDIIEDALSLKRGSLDEEISAAAQLEESPAIEHAATDTPKQLSPEPAKPGAPEETTLERLDSSEKAILELYRRASDEGKIMIRRTAVAVPKTDD